MEFTTNISSNNAVQKHYNPGKPRNPATRSSSDNMTDYLVVLHLVTTGKPADELGIDETPICLLTFLIHDVVNNKVVAIQQNHVKPLMIPGQTDATEISNGRACISKECHLETGLLDECFDNAHPLEQVIDEFDRFLRTKGIHPEAGGRTFTLLTDGQVPLRLVFHPEATHKKIDLSYYNLFWRFFDLRKVFASFYKNVDRSESITDMLKYLDVTPDESVEYGVRKAMDMSRIISRLINDGYLWNDLDVINEHYYPAIVKKSDVVDDETVVRARGLPWQATDGDIHKFFRGINIEHGGIALVLSKVGRRNGEALIRLANKEARDLALKKHRHHMNQRYIEVYRAAGRDFVNVAGGETKEAEEFLARFIDSQQTLIRMRGLPYTVSPEQIIDFFKNANCPVQFDEKGILFVNHKDGRATGDAFVIFDSEEGAERALGHHRQHIGNRYIELFKSTPAEVNQVLNSFLNPMLNYDNESGDQAGLLSFNTFGGLCHVNTSGPSLAKVFIRIQGMPIDATVADILTFLDTYSHSIVYHGVHMVYNALGQPAGEAIIQMSNETAAMYTAESKNKKFFYLMNGKRSQVDVTQCTSADVSQLTGIPPSPAVAKTVQTSPLLQCPALSPIAGGLPPTQLFYHKSISNSSNTASSFIPTCIALTNGLNLNPLDAVAFTGRAPIAYQSLQLYPTYQNAVAAVTAMPQWPYINSSLANSPSVVNASPQQNMTTNGIPQNSQALFAITTAQEAALMQASAMQQIVTAGCYNIPAPMQPGLVNTVIAKGLPKDVDFDEILRIFEQVTSNSPQMIPDVKISLGTNGMPSGEAFVSFHSRQEAERALNECNHSLLRNHCVELILAQPSLIQAM